MPQTVKTNCRFCGYQCGLTATVENGRVTGVAPDPTQYPGDERIQHGCHRWRMAPQFLDHPDRVNYPLKRVGERGSGQWHRISWDQALDEIAEKLAGLRNSSGRKPCHLHRRPPCRLLAPAPFHDPLRQSQQCRYRPDLLEPRTLLHAISYGWPSITSWNRPDRLPDVVGGKPRRIRQLTAVAQDPAVQPDRQTADRGRSPPHQDG